MIRGQVDWIVEDRRLTVDCNSFLVLGDGHKYSMNIDFALPVETCCVFFRTGFVEKVAQDMTTTLESSLNASSREARPLALPICDQPYENRDLDISVRLPTSPPV